MRIWSLSLAFNFLLVIADTPGMAADVEAGKTAFKKCALCHTTEAGKNKLGPSLFGVVGRKSATLEDFNYSEAMKKFEPQYRLVRVGLATKTERASRQQRKQRKNRQKTLRGTAKVKGAKAKKEK